VRRDTPLFFGNPNQHFVESMTKLEEFVEKNNGRNNCYWTHNAVTRDRQKVLLRYIPFDFDCVIEDVSKVTNEDLEGPRKDVLRLRDWALKKGLEPLPVFSAGKGYHGYLEFKPVLVKADHDLQALYKGIQLAAVEEAGLETADPHLHGDHQRILRIPGTQHTMTGLFCNELPWSVLEQGVDACKRYSRAPRPPLSRPSPTLTAVAWMKEHGLEPRSGGSGYGPSAQIAEYKGGDALIKNLLPRMCIHNAIVKQQVPHVVRMEAALTLALSGFDPASITNFFMQVGREAGWTKLNREVTMDQAAQIHRNRNVYKLHSCGRLRSEGLCIGSACPIFKSVFGSEAKK
jgi:hypothetical protein